MGVYPLIVFLPLLGALVAGFWVDHSGRSATEWIASIFVTISAVLSWIVFLTTLDFPDDSRVFLFTWLESGSFSADWALRIDPLTLMMLVVVNSISALVHWYSMGYMADDPGRRRFFSYLSLFTFAMLMLVTSDNFLQMFFGWEGVGLASYLLIGFWHIRPSANAASMKAFIVNRVGDFGFILGILGVFVLFGSLDFVTIFSALELYNQDHSAGLHTSKIFDSIQIDALTFVCLLLFMGAMGKSAQFLFHTWLPDAMEGPTPVSALIHAATMVTAGVFMVARLSPLFSSSESAMTIITFVGASTAFFAASVALVQNDIKRVIAYSTCSQLGYMFAALGVGAFSVAVFHLFTHAFFKALLFLGAGSVIHAVSGEQDMQKMGGLRSEIPTTYWLMVIGTLALTGFPFTAGYFSKDAIIESLYASGSSVGYYAFIMALLTALLTSFYSWRLIFLTFHGESRFLVSTRRHIHESPAIMLVPMFVLVVGALCAGIFFKNFFIGTNWALFGGKGSAFLVNEQILDKMHHIPSWVVYAPLMAMVSGFILSFCMYLQWPKFFSGLSGQQALLYKFLLNKWYFDEAYNLIFVRPAFWLGRLFWKGGDSYIIDGFGPNAVAARVLDVTRRLSRFETGYIYHYALMMFLGLVALITWFLLSGGH